MAGAQQKRIEPNVITKRKIMDTVWAGIVYIMGFMLFFLHFLEVWSIQKSLVFVNEFSCW